MSQEQFIEDCILNASGFIHAYMHTGDMTFVQVGDGENQGYFDIPKDTVSQEMHVKNLIVTKASNFMAKRMRPGANWGSGIGYLEVGTGVGSGTAQSPQAETLAQTALRTPLLRKAITSWTYLDTNGNPTATEGNVVQITTTFDGTEANGAIVEMGLFGGDATVTAGSGYMFNYKTFPVWNKQAGMQLTVVWKLTF